MTLIASVLLAASFLRAEMTSSQPTRALRLCQEKELVGYWVMIAQDVAPPYAQAHPDLWNEPIFFENQFVAFYEDGTIQDVARRGYTPEDKAKAAQKIKDLAANVDEMKRFPREQRYEVASTNGVLSRKKKGELVSVDLCNWVTGEFNHGSGQKAYPGDIVIGVLAPVPGQQGLQVIDEQLFRRVKGR
jgi:hypothetical protein